MLCHLFGGNGFRNTRYSDSNNGIDQLFELLPAKMEYTIKNILFTNHYKGIIKERDWIFPNVDATGSFFNYWNKGIKQFKS